uniref:Uncharacterized protein n=1 Tax=Glossina palpalis gambiensis TaxID=67801 RepID=A0A1B0AU38_9MUSC
MSRHRSRKMNSAVPPQPVLGPVLFDPFVNALAEIVDAMDSIYFGDDIFIPLSSDQWTDDSCKARINKCLEEKGKQISSTLPAFVPSPPLGCSKPKYNIHVNILKTMVFLLVSFRFKLRFVSSEAFVNKCNQHCLTAT